MRMRATARQMALPRRLPFSRSLARGLAGKPEAASSVAELFQSMQYTSAPESSEVANAWLDSHHRQFGFFIDNQWLKPEDRATASSTQPSNGALLAQSLQAEAEDVDNAVAAARRAQGDGEHALLPERGHADQPAHGAVPGGRPGRPSQGRGAVPGRRLGEGDARVAHVPRARGRHPHVAPGHRCARGDAR